MAKKSELIIPAEDLPIVYEATTLGITKRLTYQQAEKVAYTLDRMSGSVQFWVGDFMIIAEKEFGEEFAQLVPEGESRETWRKYKWVCERVSPDVRRVELTFSHHEIVAKMEPEEQARWLELAVKDRLTKAQLKEAIKAAKEPKDGPGEGGGGSDDKSSGMMFTTCPQCGHEFRIGGEDE